MALLKEVVEREDFLRDWRSAIFIARDPDLLNTLPGVACVPWEQVEHQLPYVAPNRALPEH